MAIGDLSATLEANGSYIKIKAEGLSTGGTYSDFGFGANHDPTNAEIVITLTRPGYTDDGTPTTYQHTIYGVPDVNQGAVRLPYPNQNSPDEVINGSDVDIRIKLHDPIYDGDTNISIDIDAGWYTQGGTPTNALVGGSIVNASTFDYPKVIGHFLDLQNKTLVGTSHLLEFGAYHKWAKDGKPVACVKYTYTDESLNTVSGTITEMGISSQSDINKVLAYTELVDLSSLTDLETITLEVQAYPWIGDSNSVLDTDDAVNLFPTEKYTNLKFRLDKTGQHGFTVVDPTSGNDGTGAVYSSQVAAESGNAYQTHSAALTAMQAYHNTNISRNDAGGGTILLTEDTHVINTTNGGSVTEWVNFKPVSTASKANVIFQPAGVNSSLPIFAKVEGCTVLTGNNVWTGAGSRYFAWEDCTLGSDGGTLYDLTSYNSYYMASIGCDGVSEFLPFGASPSCWVYMRSNNLSDFRICNATVIIGNNNIGIHERTSSVPLQNEQDGLIFQGNRVENNNDRMIRVAELDNIVHGMAFIQNIWERITGAIQPLMQISSDNSDSTTNHIILWHNVTAGERNNIGYDENGIEQPNRNWSMINNCLARCNCKQDIFTTDGNNIGGWYIRYGEGGNGNIVSTNNSDLWWINEFPQGLWAKWGNSVTPLAMGYTDDKSKDGDNTGGGDYHLDDGAPGKGWLHKLVIPYDFDGDPYSIGSDVGAYSGYEGGLRFSNIGSMSGGMQEIEGGFE